MKGFTRDHKFIPMTDYKKVTRKSRDSKTMSEGIRLRRDKKIPVYNTKVNWDNKRKPFKMWIVKHPEGSDVVKGSVTIVMAEHYGQAIDDYITIWNKENRMNRKIGYPVVQGTADKNFRYKRDEQVITIDGHSTILPADPNSSEDEDRHAEQTVRIGLVKRRQALALIKKSSPKGISDWEIREILGSEALPEIRVLSKIDKTVVEKDGIFKVAKK